MGCLAAVFIAFAMAGLWHLAGALSRAGEMDPLVRLLTIGGGTSEIMKEIIAKLRGF